MRESAAEWKFRGAFPVRRQIAAPGQLQTFRESLRKTVGTPPRLHYNENRILKKKRDVAKKKG
jgi:hypothetical protein